MRLAEDLVFNTIHITTEDMAQLIRITISIAQLINTPLYPINAAIIIILKRNGKKHTTAESTITTTMITLPTKPWKILSTTLKTWTLLLVLLQPSITSRKLIHARTTSSPGG